MSDLVERLRSIAGAAYVLTGPAAEDFTHDATFMEHSLLAVVRPADTAQVADAIRACAAAGAPVVARGAGTSLVGGPVPLAGGVVLSLDRLTTLEIDVANTVAVAGAGVITRQLDEAANAHGLMYPPDPASVELSTIGGNVACNSGGLRCVKYGVTADYVVGLTVVLADGQVLRLGGRLRKRSSGYRLLHLFVGSEGTLGVVTEVIVKLVPLPRHRATAMVGFRSVEEAAAAVSRMLSSGHLPAAIELLDRGAVDLVRDRLPAGFEPDLDAVLVVEQDGSDEELVQQELLRMVELLDGVDNRVAQSSAERERLWDARRGFGKVLMGMPHSFFAEDVAVPVGAIPEMARRVARLAAETGLGIVTVGHVGDGNLHPTIIFREDQRHLVSRAAARIFRDALELGGTISAEHGLGALKRDYAEEEHGPLALGLMRRLKQTLDPLGILNPHKVLPERPAADDFLDRIPGWNPDPERRARRAEAGV
ncbi:MAG TPA: FAD-linked oxidase C-terminal domain-containing protein [Candidatus Dormibacteraeota bacterium]|nr:FAD-linked oxidase C-terminal domain-containing protein [Candidatus Dormibacteraeota bacterium]